MNKMTTRYSIKDNSNNSRDGILYGGSIETGGSGRNYKDVARLPNDVAEVSDNTNSYIKVGGSAIETNKATISCWINPTGESQESAGVVTSTSQDGKVYGMVLKANGQQQNIGYVWGTTTAEQDIDFGISIPIDEWSHVLLIIYESGLSRLFVNNVYVANHDTGFIRKRAVLDNIEVGRFSGMIDNVSFYSDTLDFGNVQLNSLATHEVSYVYTQNRAEFEPSDEESPIKTELVDNFIEQTNGIRFYYQQSDEYTEAHNKYIDNTLNVMNTTGGYLEDVVANQSSERQDEQKFTVIGGPNADLRRFADGKFRTIPGEIVELQ